MCTDENSCCRSSSICCRFWCERKFLRQNCRTKFGFADARRQEENALCSVKKSELSTSKTDRDRNDSQRRCGRTECKDAAVVAHQS